MRVAVALSGIETAPARALVERLRDRVAREAAAAALRTGTADGARARVRIETPGGRPAPRTFPES